MFSCSFPLHLRAGYALGKQVIYSNRSRPGTVISHPGPLMQNPRDYFQPAKTTITENEEQVEAKSKATVIEPSEMFAGSDVWGSGGAAHNNDDDHGTTKSKTPITIGDSWRNLHDLLLANGNGAKSNSGDGDGGSNPIRSLLLENDLRALATVTSRAEIHHLLHEVMPDTLRDRISSHPQFDSDTLEEIFIHLGMDVELRSCTRDIYKVAQATSEEIAFMSKRIGGFGDDGRACVNNTLHRVSCWMSRSGHIVGLTVRIGRFVPFAASSFLNAAIKGSLLLLSPPSCGKTTCLRDLATQIARLPQNYRVVVIDTSNEIGGDSEVPLPYLHRVRRLQVPRRSLQLNYMIQAVQNHAPDFVIIDEIANKEEAECAVSMSQRGIKLIATAHASTLHSLLQNSELNPLVGGVAHAFLSNEERRLRKKHKKTILERMSSSPFRTVVELQGRNTARIIRHVNDCVDLILDTGSLDDANNTFLNTSRSKKNSSPPAIPWVQENVKMDDPTHVMKQQEIDAKREIDSEVIAVLEVAAAASAGEGHHHQHQHPKSASAVSSSSSSTSSFSPSTTTTTTTTSYSTVPSSNSHVTCFRCGTRGHKAHECPKYKRLMEATSTTPEAANAVSKKNRSSSSSTEGLFAFVSEDGKAVKSSNKFEKVPHQSPTFDVDDDDETAEGEENSDQQWWDKLERTGESGNKKTRSSQAKATMEELLCKHDSMAVKKTTTKDEKENEQNQQPTQWWDKLDASLDSDNDELNETHTQTTKKVKSSYDQDGYVELGVEDRK